MVVLPRIGRVAIAAVFAALFSFQAVRTAAVSNRSTRDSLGARLWPSHPEVILNRAMAQVGALAARGQPPSPAIFAAMEEIARKAPLAPEPFLVKGAMARVQGRNDVAERLFAEALARDPRSEAVRYLLADLYVHTGRQSQALMEMGVFARLMPAAAGQVAPGIASFARTPGAVPRLRRFFRRFPELEPLVLLELSKDAGNVDVVLALAERANRRPDDVSIWWLETLVRQLIAQGKFVKAYDAWKTITGIRGSGREIFNPGFEPLSAPPPFNWKFASHGGVAEPLGGGRLRVIYYGSENTVLAEQLLLLPPGRYELSMTVSGDLGGDSAVEWSVICLPQTNNIFTLPLGKTAGALKGTFSVMAGCTAQRLALAGSASEFPQPIDFSIEGFKLTMVPANEQ